MLDNFHGGENPSWFFFLQCQGRTKRLTLNWSLSYTYFKVHPEVDQDPVRGWVQTEWVVPIHDDDGDDVTDDADRVAGRYVESLLYHLRVHGIRFRLGQNTVFDGHSYKRKWER